MISPDMSFDFEELAYEETPLGELVLRRRGEPRLRGKVVYEVKLGEDFLMSSLFTEGETALAELGLARVDAPELDVVVGGLGLGYTAAAALRDSRVRSLTVVEALPEIIEWHRDGLVPLGAELVSDPRCRFVAGDFFELAAGSGPGFDPGELRRRFHAVLLDVDHSPRHVLHERNRAFYTPAGLDSLATRLRPGGVFALWSNDPPDDEFADTLRAVFDSTEAKVVAFPNPYSGGESSCTVYVAATAVT